MLALIWFLLFVVSVFFGFHWAVDLYATWGRDFLEAPLMWLMISLPALFFLALFINRIKKTRYKKEIKNFSRQVYEDMKASGYSESEARLRSAQAASDYHNVNVHNARQGLKDVPEDFMPKQKRQWISINQWLGRK